MELNYKKEIYTTPELLKEVSIARAVFFRYQKDWIVKGRCPTLMRQFYKGFKNKEYYLKRITEDNTAQNDFYKRHLVKDRSGIMHLLKTPSSKYTYRKKK